MKFTDIPEKCPNTWEDYCKWVYSKHNYYPKWRTFNELVGDLILDYLPSKGIEIERFAYWRGGKYWIDYTVKCTADTFEFDTLEEAICKAFEILEGREK